MTRPGFILLCNSGGIAHWQARAIELLLLEGMDLISVVVLPGAEIEGQDGPPVPLDSVVPAATPRLSLEQVATLQSLESLERDRELLFALCLIEERTLPPLSIHPRLGYWYWQFGDAQPGCWRAIAVGEISRGEVTVDARLLTRLSSDGPALVLYEGRFPVAIHSVNKSRQRVLSSCPEWARIALRKLSLKPQALAELDPWRNNGPGGTAPIAGKLSLSTALLKGFFRRFYQEFLQEEKWTLGIIDRPIASLLTQVELAGIRWLDELPGGDYLADPLGVQGWDDTLLAEAFDAAAGRGYIVSVQLSEPYERRVLLKGSGHCSYPFTISDHGRKYCIPEQLDSERVTLYPLLEAPLALGPGKTLFEGLAGVDCTFFFRDGLWWLFGGKSEDQDTVKLFAWYSASLDGAWEPHPLNPVRTDVTGARSAGPLFEHQGELYRPAQDCSGSYGSAVVIYRVVELSPTAFAEERVARIAPDVDSPYADGLHTVSAVGDRTVVDAKRHYVSLRKAGRAARKYLARCRPGTAC